VNGWYDSQKKPRSNIRKLLQERIGKGNPRRNLTAEESKRLAKLEAIAHKLKSGENGALTAPESDCNINRCARDVKPGHEHSGS